MSAPEFEHPFGEREEGTQVQYREPTHLHGYRPRGRYILKTVGTGYIREDADTPRKDHTVTTALVVSTETPPTVTGDQLDLIKRTVAAGATADELKLYLFDCQRQGVHPLDKLVHFTKRAGKYTPITSIDFMRIRAAETGEYAGSDDAEFTPHANPNIKEPETASVTVWRLVQGTRCPFSATARWAEYKPDQNDFMWKKMPHTMLAKCAEALALRKGFPRQLAGLYAKEEMDQADGPRGHVVEAPAVSHGHSPSTPAVAAALAPSVPNGGDSGRSDEGPDHGVDLPAGARLVTHVGPGRAGSEGEITFNNGDRFLTWKKVVVDLAKQFQRNRTPCFPDFKKSASGNQRIEGLVVVPKDYTPPSGLPQVPLTEEPPF